MDRSDKLGQLPRRPPPEAAGSASALDDSATGGHRSGARSIVFVVLAVAAVAIFFTWRSRSANSEKKGAGAGAGRTNLPPISVIAGTAEAKDVPIYLDGLGTVQAFNTVTVHVQVEWLLTKVAFEEGQDVHPGDVLAQIDPLPFQTMVEQNMAKQAQDQAQLTNAKLLLVRDTQLLDQRILPQQDFDTQKALVDQYDAAVKADQAAIDSAKVQLAYTTVVSPIEGRTGLRLVDQGNIVHPTDSSGLVVITQLKPISVVFTLPEQNLGDIQKSRESGVLSVLAVDRDNKTVLGRGKLAVLDNQIDTTTGTLKLKATFPNEDLRLWPGQFVNARLLVATRKSGVVVPASVVQRGPEGPYAFVITKELKTQIQRVKVGQTEEGYALIDEGLRPGDRVVVDGQYKLQAGSTVKISQDGKGLGAQEDDGN